MRHKHDFYLVEFVFGAWWECSCGHRPTEREFNRWVKRNGLGGETE